MFRDMEIVKTYLISKFGSVEAVVAGTYSIPTTTSQGDAFMRVTVDAKGFLSDFTLWWDEECTQCWYKVNKDGSPK